MASVRKTSTDREARVASAVESLIAHHRTLGERMTGALWLKTKEPGVWVLEVMPDMPADERAEEPMEFTPSSSFRFTLNLLTGREEDFRKALRRNPDFAAAV